MSNRGYNEKLELPVQTASHIIDARVVNAERNITAIAGALGTLNNTVTAITQDVSNMKRVDADISQRITTIEARLAEITITLQQLSDKVCECTVDKAVDSVVYDSVDDTVVQSDVVVQSDTSNVVDDVVDTGAKKRRGKKPSK
jgi:uncharacterized coiled-coil protein SlyX